MMIFYRVVCVSCLLLLLVTKAAIVAALQSGDLSRVRVLQFFRLGLGLSACSYLLRILNVPPNMLLSLGSMLSCFVGTLLIYIGWMEHINLCHERRKPPAHVRQSGERGLEMPASAEVGLPPLDVSARHVLRHARNAARHQRQCCVDTDHLLLGLLQEPSCAGCGILTRLGVPHENICRALGGSPEQESLSRQCGPAMHTAEKMHPAEQQPLTERARQVVALSEQEAHRFNQSHVGTEHLLLGLVLMGRGAAALTLFQEGVTVENIRGEILRKPAA